MLKLFKTGVPTAGILAGVGYLFAQLASMWYISEAAGRSTVGAEHVADTLEFRLPISMAAWGFGLIALFEGALAIWHTPPAPIEPAVPTVDETEQLLLKLLEEAEAAEALRQLQAALAEPSRKDSAAPPVPDAAVAAG